MSFIILHYGDEYSLFIIKVSNIFLYFNYLNLPKPFLFIQSLT